MTNINDELGLVEEFGEDRSHEIIGHLADCKTDFTTGNYRFIQEDVIDTILEDELSNDEYILGCFNAEFIARITDWPQFLIEAAQKGGQHEEIGKALVQNGHVEDLAYEYQTADGYGHHFAHYDSEQHELEIDSDPEDPNAPVFTYFWFKVN